MPCSCSQAVLLLEILRAAHARGEKVLVFSQNLATLEFMERLVQTNLVWERKHILHLDGNTLHKARQRLIDGFNDPESDARVFFLSLKAGNLGINLTAATRTILLDTSWNPADDNQAIFRNYRSHCSSRLTFSPYTARLSLLLLPTHFLLSNFTLPDVTVVNKMRNELYNE
jgi:SNF2 family DNA or RNA helicase